MSDDRRQTIELAINETLDVILERDINSDEWVDALKGLWAALRMFKDDERFALEHLALLDHLLTVTNTCVALSKVKARGPDDVDTVLLFVETAKLRLRLIGKNAEGGA